jgi:hypothetical protein
MRNIFNTSYKVQSDVNTEEERLYFNIEDGAYVTTSAGVWTIWNGEWVKLYPQAGVGTGLGWSRYDDGQYTSANKLSLAQDTEVVLPNNAATSYRSYTGVDYYDSSTSKVLAENENDVYIMTIVFKASAANANSTYLEVSLQGVNGTPYDRIRNTVGFPKGNDVEHSEHMIFQYYADSNFVSNGSRVEVMAVGGTAEVWDIIYFIQKTQSYA